MQFRNAMIMAQSLSYVMFDEKLYNSLYKVFGGHIRFYSYYWKRIKFASHDDIIGELQQESRIMFGSCLNSVFFFLRDAEELEAFLCKLRDQNFSVPIINGELYRTALQLVSCNLLFYDSCRVQIKLQNHLRKY